MQSGSSNFTPLHTTTNTSLYICPARLQRIRGRCRCCCCTNGAAAPPTDGLNEPGRRTRNKAHERTSRLQTHPLVNPGILGVLGGPPAPMRTTEHDQHIGLEDKEGPEIRGFCGEAPSFCRVSAFLPGFSASARGDGLRHKPGYDNVPPNWRSAHQGESQEAMENPSYSYSLPQHLRQSPKRTVKKKWLIKNLCARYSPAPVAK